MSYENTYSGAGGGVTGKKSWTTGKCDLCGIPVINRVTCGSCIEAVKQLTRVNPRAYKHLAEKLGIQV